MRQSCSPSSPAGISGSTWHPNALSGVPVGLLRADILGQKSPFEDTADNPAAVSRIEVCLDRAGAATTDVTLVTEEARSSFESGFGKVVIGGLTHDTLGFLAAAGAEVTDIAELHAFNLRRPRTRMPKGQFIISLAYLFGIDRTAYQRSALRHRKMAEGILEATFETNAVELLVSLSNCHSSLYATAGYPAITVPLGLRTNGMPVGVTLIGRPGADARLLEYAFAFEHATHLRAEPQTH